MSHSAAHRRVLIVGVAGCLIWSGGCSDPSSEARAAIEINDFGRALSILDDAIGSAPRNVELRTLLLLVQEKLGDWPQAVETARVVTTLEPTPRNELRLIHAQARAGHTSATRHALEEWPPQRVEEMLLQALFERGTIDVPPLQAIESDEDYLYLAENQDPAVYRQAAEAVGAHLFWAARLVVLAAEQERDDYLNAERVAGALNELKAMSPELTSEVRDVAEDVLRRLEEPERPVRTGNAAIDSGNWQLHFTRLERYHLALGYLQAALATTESDARRAALSYRTAIDAWDMNPGRGRRTAPGIGLLRLIDLLAELDAEEELALECRRARTQYPSWYESYEPRGCQRINM